MIPQVFLAQAKIGDVVQVSWIGALFDPDAYIKPGDKAKKFVSVCSCGFVADKGDDYISIGIDGMYEAGNSQPSFRTILTLPIINLTNGEIFGTIPPAPAP